MYTHIFSLSHFLSICACVYLEIITCLSLHYRIMVSVNAYSVYNVGAWIYTLVYIHVQASKEIDHSTASLVDDMPWHLYDTNSIQDITALAFHACLNKDEYTWTKRAKFRHIFGLLFGCFVTLTCVTMTSRIIYIPSLFENGKYF